MKRFYAFLAATAVALLSVANVSATEPDSPGTKLITIQAGGGYGYGGFLSGNIAMANVMAGHLYGGLQLGANFRQGALMGTKKTDYTLAPRVMLGWNLGRVVELHVGGLAGVAAQRFDTDKSMLTFCYGGFGGFRFNVSDSFGLVLEGSYSNCLPYATGGIAFRF
jgi:hypothetical protein